MMKTVALLLLAFSLHVSAKTYSQSISLSLTNAKLATVFAAIEKQTDHRFVYTREQLSDAQQISISVKNATLETVLGICFNDQPLSYVIEDRFIIIRQKQKVATETKSEIALPDIRGKIINEEGEPVAGVTIAVKGTKNGTTSDANGEFILKDVQPDAVLQISSIGYAAAEIRVQGRVLLTVQLKIQVSNLDETVVIAYGTTTKRLNTGSVGKVTAEEISRQPVSNPLATLQGRVPGLLVTQGNGVPGSSFRIQLRGKGSLAQGTDPLILIDGVPFAANNSNVNQLTSAASSFGGNGISPFYSINPADIESIEILKDADATAIYGSRGANGVILITTKKANSGTTKVSINSYTGISQPSKLPTLLNTKDYLQMRKEAFANDGLIPNIFSAPDLLLWDSNRNTNFSKLLLRDNVNSYSFNSSISGGVRNLKFQLGAGYFNEGIIFRGQQPSERVTLHSNIRHSGFDEKLKIEFSAFYSSTKNNSTGADISTYLLSPPNLPALYDSTGKLNWQQSGVGFDNPLSYLEVKYKATTENLMGNIVLSYAVLQRLLLKVNLGYNSLLFDENYVIPKIAQNPAYSPLGYSRFGNKKYKSIITEPQIQYSDSIRKGMLSVLVGSTIQEQEERSNRIIADGYTNDALLQSLSGAASYSVSNQFSLYRYAGFFGRVNFQYANKYILNLTGRRDGSTKFGPGKQWGSFGSIGAAWIFSNEAFVSAKQKWISFGKIRASYGSSGNDQIGNYQYLDGWAVQSNPYQSIPGMVPARLFNKNYSWELSRKMELGIELGLFKNRIFAEFSFYKHRSSNQLVQYALPAQTGFNSVIANFPALIQNTGTEINLETKIIDQTDLKWSINGSITIPRNKLLSFPNFETSSYASTYVVGNPLSILYNFHFIGVDGGTGFYQFQDVNGDGIYSGKDYQINGNTAPKYYGGAGTSLSYKSWSIAIFADYRKQTGRTYLWSLFSVPPGGMLNLPNYYMQRWKMTGDPGIHQRLTTNAGTAAGIAFQRLQSSDGIYGDASFIRIKNISIGWECPSNWLAKMRLESLKFYMNSQNPFTISSYKGTDPETQNLIALPPMKTVVIGFQLTF